MCHKIVGHWSAPCAEIADDCIGQFELFVGLDDAYCLTQETAQEMLRSCCWNRIWFIFSCPTTSAARSYAMHYFFGFKLCAGCTYTCTGTSPWFLVLEHLQHGGTAGIFLSHMCDSRLQVCASRQPVCASRQQVCASRLQVCASRQLVCASRQHACANRRQVCASR